MYDAAFAFNEQDGFRCFGTGRTFPVMSRGRIHLLVAAVGTVLDGSGWYRGLEGTIVFNGALTPGRGFAGHITGRFPDPTGRGHTGGAHLSAQSRNNPESRGTYLVLRGEKKDRSQKSWYRFARDGSLRGLETTAQLRSVLPDSPDRGRGDAASGLRAGRVVGKLDATIFFDITAPAGTPAAPTPFTTEELYTFFDASGRTIGTIRADVVEGWSFGLRLPAAPGQPALRFGGFGPIRGGTGVYEGIQGMLAINSAIGIAPHALSLMHVLRITRPAADSSRATSTPRPPESAATRPALDPVVRERDLALESGVRMHYRESGAPDGKPILMLHGNPASSYAWTEVMRELGGVGRCIAPDLIGYGDSDKPSIPYSFYNHAEYLDQFVRALDLRDLTLFIQDWGGALGFDHAARHQANVRGIAFFEAILKPYESWDEFPMRIDAEKLRRGDPQQTKSALARQKFREFREGDIGGLGWKQVVEENMFLNVFMGPLLGHPFDPRKIPQPLQDPVLGPLLWPYFRPFPTPESRLPIWRFSRQIPIAGEPADMTATVGQYSRVLAEWDVPKLLIYSDKGPTLKEEHAQWVRENWQNNLTVRCLDEVGGTVVTEGTHFLQQTHPKQVAAFFTEWFRELDQYGREPVPHVMSGAARTGGNPT
jgi:haloalkane dehalogenase